MNKTRWEQIEDLYHAALERPRTERSEYISNECAGDAELFREVESLLSSADTKDSFLAKPEFDLGLEILAKPDHVLKSGQDFGHYKILNFLGRGGMGEVYLAEDTKLGRPVALKVLPANVASDQERIRRFIQEARAASALNHPNILTIHEIGEADGWRFIASEYVEGKNLREYIKGDGPLELHSVIDLALQIAAALNAAHKVRIVHRDVKPENIMLREDGLVKVLDFGLAKLIESPDSEKPAVGFASTNPGMVMGTIAYMSPEQTRGRKTDARSDIWSLGVVLYEMLVGRLPFGGETSSDMIAAILTTEPALHENDPMWVPESLWRVISKSLHKNPDERYQSVNEMADDLRNVFSDADQLSTGDFRKPTDFRMIGRTDPAFAATGEALRRSQPEIISARRSGYRVGVAMASVFAVILVGGFGGLLVLKNSTWMVREPMNIARIFDAGKMISAAISPDGNYIAHALSDGGKQSLWIKHIATNNNRELIGPENVGYKIVGFSKDGGYIYFQNGSGLFQIPVLGGDAKKINDRVEGSVSFSPDQRQFVYVKAVSEDQNALIIADVDGGTEMQLATSQAPLSFTGTPAWSPDGKHIACGIFNGQGKLATIMLFPVAGGEAIPFSTQKWKGVDELAWLANGSGLLAVAGPAEGTSLPQIWLLPTSGGTPRLITNDLNRYTQMSVTADSNRLLAIQWENRVNLWYAPGGKADGARLLSNNIYSQFKYVALTPDGRIVFPSAGNEEGSRDIWIMNSDGTGAKRLTSSGNSITPCATTDGKYILFSSNRGDLKTYHIWRINTDGSDLKQLTNGPSGERGPSCSSDAETVIYATGGPDAGIKGSSIWKTSVKGGESTQLTSYPSLGPDVSPDGKYISIKIQPDPNGPMKLGIIPISGGQPVKVFDAKHNGPARWKPDGSSITYIRKDDGVENIWEQPINGGPPRPITKFTDETIQGFAWLKNGDLVCARGFEARDPVLISNFQ